MRIVSAGIMGLLGAAAAVVTPAAPVDDQPIQIEVKVLPRGSDAPLFVARTPLETRRTMAFEQRASKGPEKLELKIEGDPRDGELSFDVSYLETTHDGESLAWRPAFRAKRGETIEASVDWNGEGRRMLVFVK